MHTKYFLDIRDIAEMLGVSERTAHAITKREGFPPPVDLLPGRSKRRASEVIAYFDGVGYRTEQRGEPAQLIAGKSRKREQAVA